MTLINALLRTVYHSRLQAMERMRRDPMAVQAEQFSTLIKGAGSYLQNYKIKSQADFRAQVPVVGYDELIPAIDKVRSGEDPLHLWGESPTRWFAKSSGTTGSASKFIPITQTYLKGCHYQGGHDVLAVVAHNFPDSKAFSGKALTLGGSAQIEHSSGGGSSHAIGDLSAILIDNTPAWVSLLLREPKAAIALIPDFEQKIEAIVQHTVDKRITSFAGVPSWNLVLMNKVLETTGKSHIGEVWPDMSLFIHGGIAFTPYRAEYERLFPMQQMHYVETYNASEGFFAIQDDPTDSSMLLMLDYGVYYEFIPMATLADPSSAVPLEGVKTGVQYAMVISTACGLWRYMIGDTIEFTSTTPYKIRITGRTKQFINAFGEELMVDNAERALAVACGVTGAEVREYTVAPIYMTGTNRGAHEWLVEFSIPPHDAEQFADVLDGALRAVNTDYGAKRSLGSTLDRLKLRVAHTGLFMDWMASRGKVGGQHKVPRLCADRRYMDELLGR